MARSMLESVSPVTDGAPAVARMVDPQVKKARMERSIADENGCPGMHVLVSAAGDERAGP